MKRLLLLGLLVCAGSAVAAENAADPFVNGNAEAGAAKAATCAACHGPGGNSSNPEWPKLAGQSSKYIYEQLVAFKSAQRKQPIMMGQATLLSEQEMRDVAAFFSQQKQQPGVASPDSVKVAEKIFRAGDAKRDLPACAGCHGPKGAGNPAAGYARIGGQHAAYTTIQLKSFRAGERNIGTNGQMMTAVASKLTDAEITALASYLNGLQ
ncbi:MAG TPA: c-type cytochrome [Nevskiaceae bacterium]|nr:c-type cytochrome [Nevskiaceae bacterium]